MVKVSGVPYDVDLPVPQGNLPDLPSLDDMVATLEQENRQMRARMDRLEDELYVANEIMIKQNIENLNLHTKIKELTCQDG
jgi:predicted nuclease with TOPRIM domain